MGKATRTVFAVTLVSGFAHAGEPVEVVLPSQTVVGNTPPTSATVPTHVPASPASTDPTAPHVMSAEELRRSMREQLGVMRKKHTPSGPNSVKLFDTENATPGLELRAGLLEFRRGDQIAKGFQGGGFDFSISRTTQSQSGNFFLNGVQGTHLRVLDSKSFLWSILTQELASGVTLGPLEIEGRFGFSLLNLDRLGGDGWNFSMLAPKVGVNAGLRIWRIRADFGIHSEYYWRWFGPDVLMHAATIGIRFESKFEQGDLLKPGEKQELPTGPATRAH